MKKPTFFTSDWHIGHKSVLKYSKRPFADVDQMARVLIKNFNSTVPKNGICYFGGDMGLTSGTAILDIVSQLNGTKVLILGNHDKGMNACYKMGFDVVTYGVVLQICKTMVTFTHCPLRDVYREDVTDMIGAEEGEPWHGSKRHIPYSIPSWGQFHLHGHIHSPNGGKSEKILDKQFDVGVDANNYRPVSISTIESWLNLTFLKEGDSDLTS